VDRDYIIAYLLTLIIEVPIVLLIYRKNTLRIFIISLISNTFTHTTVHFILIKLLTSLYIWLIVSEIYAFSIEALTYYLFSKDRRLSLALISSGVSNSVSYAVGIIIFNTPFYTG